MTKRFESKKAFVTGAGQGIGFEICRKFAEEGAVVGLNSLTETETQQAVKRIQGAVAEAEIAAYPADISDLEKIQSQIEAFAADNGGLDIFMAGAGITTSLPFLELKPEHFDPMFSVNCRGTFFSVQTAAKIMKAQGRGGRIVLMSSVCGIQAHRDMSAYGMTKAAIKNLTKNLAVELGAYGITVNAVAPCAIVNERTSEDPEYVDGWVQVTPNRAIGKPEDVAHAVLFLADERSSHINGEVLMVDGGWTVASPLPQHLDQPDE